MQGPYGFEPNEHCQNCQVKGNGFFCKMPPSAMKDFEAVKYTSVYPAGAVLFLEKQDPRGVFVLCSGEIKLSFGSSAGKTLILKIAKPGDILGLMATVTGNPYEVTAETLYPSQVIFVRRENFLHFLAKHPEANAEVVRQLSASYLGACEQLRTVGLTASVPGKLARILLEWSATGKVSKNGTSIKMPLTHEQIAEFIGTSRETVTRTLGDFKHRQFVALQGSTLMVSNRAALESISGD